MPKRGLISPYPTHEQDVIPAGVPGVTSVTASLALGIPSHARHPRILSTRSSHARRETSNLDLDHPRLARI